MSLPRLALRAEAEQWKSAKSVDDLFSGIDAADEAKKLLKKLN